MSSRAPEELVDLLSGLRSQQDAALVCLGSLGGIATVGEIKAQGVGAGIPKMRDWNISVVLGRATKLARKVGDRWHLTTAGRKAVSELGLSPSSHVVFQTDALLAATISSIADKERQRFLEEAHKCFGAGLARAAVVLSWVGAAWIIQDAIFKHQLAQFNAAGIARYNKQKIVFRAINTMEDFGRVGESDLLQLAEDIGFLGKSAHKQLKDRLDFRNGCGHPNSMVVDPHTVASHIHFLCNNVYLKY